MRNKSFKVNHSISGESELRYYHVIQSLLVVLGNAMLQSMEYLALTLLQLSYMNLTLLHHRGRGDRVVTVKVILHA